MAVVRIPINPLQKGRVGAYSMYVRKGEQVVRQRKNSSNYGEEASRSLPQQKRRVLWSNLVNFYKANKAWMPKAFENIKSNQTVYNRFMQLNVDNFGVAWTKEQAQQGWCVVDDFKVSDGSLQPIRLSKLSSGDYRVNIHVGSSITTASTLGQFSQAIINEEPYYKNGDNIALILFESNYDVGLFPQVIPHYMEVTLDVESDAILENMTIFNEEISQFTDGHWNINQVDMSMIQYKALVMIHTRKDNGLKVSTQTIVMDDTSLVDRYSTPAQLQAAIESYGLDVDVPLAPSFKSATIATVTLNGSAVPNPIGKTIEVTGAQTLVISGSGLNSESVQLYHDGIPYTPLVQDANSLTYILGDNGTNRIEVNGMFAMNVVVSGIVVPEGLPTTMLMRQASVTSATPSSSQHVNGRTDVQVNCMNYRYKLSESYPYFNFGMAVPDTVQDDYTFTNCTLNTFSSTDERLRLNVSVTDPTQPAYIKYKGFIIAVFNY